MNKADVLAELTSLAEADKVASEAGEWIGDDLGRMRSITLPLAVGGAVRSGFRLHMIGPRSVPSGREFFELKANLFATVNGSLWHLGRVEFDPGGPPPHHRNEPNSRAFAPNSITGAHYHPFAENARIGLESLSPERNLPVALPEDKQFLRYDDVLGTISARFRISGFWTEDPRWLLSLA